MRILITGLLLIFNMTIQSTMLQAIQIRGVLPNTAIIIIVSYALLRGSLEGAMVGLFAGLLQDLFFGTSIGFYACLGMLSGYFIGKLHQNFYRENYILPLLFCAATTFCYETIVYCVGFLFNGKLNYFIYFHSLILPETVYTSVFSIFIYRLLFGINDYLELKERYKRRLF